MDRILARSGVVVTSLVYAALCPLAAAAGPVCTLRIEAKKIIAGDPLLAMVELKAGEEAIRLERPFGERYGTVRLRVKQPAAEQWQPLAPQLITDAFSMKDIVIEPHTSCCEFILLLYRERNFAFGEPGEYEIKAEVGTRAGLITSEPVTLSVTETDDRMQDLLRRLAAAPDPEKNPDPALEKIRTSLRVASDQCGGEENMKRLKEQFGGRPGYQNLFRFAEEAVKVSGYRRSSREEELSALGFLEKIAGERQSLWSSLARGVRAEYFSRTKQWQKAREELTKAEFESQDSRDVRYRLATTAPAKN